MSVEASAEQSAIPVLRQRLFRETPTEIFERWLLGTAWALKPERVGGLPALASVWASDLLRRDHALPDPDSALDTPAGLCGIVHDVSVPTLVEAYRRGLYPFAHFGPLKWWSLPERSVLFFDEMHIGKRMRRLMRKGQYAVTFDRNFEGVIKACAGRRSGKWHLTWITPKIMRAYAEMFDAGYAHSFEVWNERKELVGGGYGVSVGGVFFTESQFSIERDTSKLGFSVLNRHLGEWGFRLNDGKAMTPTCLDMGFRLIPRGEFLQHLHEAARTTDRRQRWEVEFDPAAVAEWQPKAAKGSAQPELAGCDQ